MRTKFESLSLIFQDFSLENFRFKFLNSNTVPGRERELKKTGGGKSLKAL
jgi:hypothetical protein